METKQPIINVQYVEKYEIQPPSTGEKIIIVIVLFNLLVGGLLFGFLR